MAQPRLSDTVNTNRLEEILRPSRAEFNVLQEALKEVNKEEGEKKKEAAKVLIREAISLKGQMEQAERTFTSEKKKFDKQLGKILNRLHNMANGRPLNEGEKNEGDDSEPEEDGSE